jgi:hypothetical protein
MLPGERRYDLPISQALAPRIGSPALVVGRDSGCGNYEQLWGTASLRGLLNGVLTVEVLTEGVPPEMRAASCPRAFALRARFSIGSKTRRRAS